MTRYLFITLTNIGRFFRNFLLLNSAAKLQRNFCRIYRRTVNMSLQPSVKLRSDLFKFYRFPFHCWACHSTWACHSKSKLGWTDLILVDHGVEHWKSLQMTRLFVDSVCDAWDIYLSEGQYCTPVHTEHEKQISRLELATFIFARPTQSEWLQNLKRNAPASLPDVDGLKQHLHWCLTRFETKRYRWLNCKCLRAWVCTRGRLFEYQCDLTRPDKWSSRK